MVLKKFIISSNCPTGPREILANGKLGSLFNTQNIKDLSNKILNFNYNIYENNKITQRAFKSLARFDFNINCEEYFKIIKKFI